MTDWKARLATMTVLVLAVSAAAPSAHDIPADVTVHAFVRPEGGTLRLLVRVPLGAMRDIEFPIRGPGFLDLARAEGQLRQAAVVWIANGVAIYEDDRQLAPPRLVTARVSLPSDRSFASYEEAVAHLRTSLDPQTEIPWDQALLDTEFEYPIASDRSRFSIHPEFARFGLRVTTVLRLVQPDNSIRAFEYVGDPGLVRLDPRWDQAAGSFLALGFRHILDGTDHLLFLLCLVIPFRRLRPLIVIVTAFTIAHSTTLIASAYGFAPDALWFPPLIETLIAASIVYMALENIVSGGGPVQRRWLMAFGFGLVHGFGFSFALRETMQFAGSHLLASLLFFNLGVEIGQILVIALLVPAIDGLFRFVVAERMGTIILSAFVAHTGWHWTTERGSRLAQYDWPALDAAAAATAVRWLMVIVGLAGAWWLTVGAWQLLRRRGRSSGDAGVTPASPDRAG